MLIVTGVNSPCNSPSLARSFNPDAGAGFDLNILSRRTGNIRMEQFLALLESMRQLHIENNVLIVRY
jgi:hypothetical protein